ncbi:glutamine--fructose-6-phosphate transaminase (isomerizing) [Buchnera aphidicola]|uniref:Glutamine--fructose-6-phosphate aminotransferase [isomerizing] n=1 Tax=Buchnera aphidicola subsp. Melaphis rhois TaxID=118103 RepID=A0A4D6Y237_BUCMH|nr:glutamine--fructose-6-phosphate transaminase (isomerizing) [Buchnera aphidicola]QCI23077.1 glutamine--fructose-6-phosphate transaminase (isomerizing) [Buchnera aphidicola (Melaphis rhois)]
MCGIIAAISRKNIINILKEGMIRLEYRGYDSSGLAIIDNKNKILRFREKGKVNNLIKSIERSHLFGNIGIAHTRWATHGKALKKNAHPHISSNISIVHNGVIENYKEIKICLKKEGYQFSSDTDTEVIAHLIHFTQNKNNKKTLLTVIQNVTKKLKGNYSMVIMDKNNPNVLLAVRSGSPLLIGIGKEENYITSDQIALLAITQRFIYLHEGDIAILTHSDITVFNSHGISKKRKETQSKINFNNVSKGLFRHYMEKEIHEQPHSIRNTILNRLTKNKTIYFSEFNTRANKILSKTEHIHIVACGTSYHAGLVSKYWFESLSMIPCDVEVASEFCYRKFVVRKNSLLLIISQSGETADNLTALRTAKNLGYLGSLAICNSKSSSLVYETDFSLLTHAGIEIGVASTKAFTAQLTVLLMLVAKFINIKKHNIKLEHDIVNILNILPDRIESILRYKNTIYTLAKKLFYKKNIIFLGKGEQYPIALEGALKIKEISYIHAEGYPIGELKHGTLALVDSKIPIIIIAPNNNLLQKIKLNIEEIQAREGLIYIFSDLFTKFNQNNSNIIRFPYIENLISPIFYSVSLQLLAYYIALIKGNNIDQPRNLAKSVTVE